MHACLYHFNKDDVTHYFLHEKLVIQKLAIVYDSLGITLSIFVTWTSFLLFFCRRSFPVSRPDQTRLTRSGNTLRTRSFTSKSGGRPTTATRPHTRPWFSPSVTSSVFDSSSFSLAWRHNFFLDFTVVNFQSKKIQPTFQDLSIAF